MERTGTQTDFDNVDIVPTSPTFNLHTEETRNAPGLATNKGVEVELTANLFEGLTAGASYTYTYTRVPLTPNPFLGNTLTPVFVVFTPENAFSGSLDYDMPIGSTSMLGRFHVDFNYADPTYSFQNETTRTDSSFIVNSSVGLAEIPLDTGRTMSLSFWTRNLLDKSHIYRRSAANAGTLGDYANFNPPRTFGIEARLGL